MTLPAPLNHTQSAPPSVMARLTDIPEEEIWLAKQKSARTDRAILSVGLQVGLRRAEIAALTVGDFHQNRGYDSLRVIRKGGRREALAINPQTVARLRAYLEPIWSMRATPATLTGRCSGRCATTASRVRRAVGWIPTPSTAWCVSTPPPSG